MPSVSPVCFVYTWQQALAMNAEHIVDSSFAFIAFPIELKPIHKTSYVLSRQASEAIGNRSSPTRWVEVMVWQLGKTFAVFVAPGCVLTHVVDARVCLYASVVHGCLRGLRVCLLTASRVPPAV
jgi:hypothetical protein